MTTKATKLAEDWVANNSGCTHWRHGKYVFDENSHHHREERRAYLAGFAAASRQLPKNKSSSIQTSPDYETLRAAGYAPPPPGMECGQCGWVWPEKPSEPQCDFHSWVHNGETNFQCAKCGAHKTIRTEKVGDTYA